MSFVQGLVDVASFYSITTSKDALGVDVKTRTILYNNIPARLHIRRITDYRGVKTQEDYQEFHLLQVEPQYNTAQRGDVVEVNNKTFLIKEIGMPKGKTIAIHHVNYYLVEQYDEFI